MSKLLLISDITNHICKHINEKPIHNIYNLNKFMININRCTLQSKMRITIGGYQKIQDIMGELFDKYLFSKFKISDNKE